MMEGSTKKGERPRKDKGKVFESDSKEPTCEPKGQAMKELGTVL